MTITTLHGDCRDVLKGLPDRSIHAFITSPPYYGLRSYSAGPGEIGNEPTPELYIAALVEVFREARRVLRDDGVCLVNLGDSYAGNNTSDGAGEQRALKSERFHGGRAHLEQRRVTNGGALPEKNLMLIPFRVALALQADGWYVRSVMPWIKRNVMPESVTDRPTTAHEYIFLLAKSARYYWDGEAIRSSASPGSLARIAQPTFDQQHGGPKDYANGTNSNRSARKALENFAQNPGRNYGTSDPYLASLDLAIDQCRAELAHLESIKARGGLLADADADPLALLVNTSAFKGSHYATFPIKLVEPLLLASVPRECCSACGAPWVRQIEKEQQPKDKQTGRGWIAGIADQDNWASGTPTHSGLGNQSYTRSVTTGFIPSCDHDAPTAPGIVGDMFAGSGTVGRVAIEHGRDAVLIELNPEYITDHIEQRTDKVQVRLPLD